MGITVGWGETDQKFLLVTFEKPWDWNDFQAAVKQTVVLAGSISHKTDLVLDIRSAGFPPEGALRRFRNVSEIEHPNIDRVIYIAPRLLAQFVKSLSTLMATAFFGHRAPEFVFVSTFEEARALVDQQSQPLGV